MHPNSMFREGRRQLLLPKSVLGRHQLMRGALNGVKRLRRAQAIWPDVARFAFDLLLDTGNPDLKEFIQVGTENREKFYSLHQRLGRVLRFFQNAPVELEPAKLAIDEILRGGKFLGRSFRYCFRKRDDVCRAAGGRGLDFRLHRQIIFYGSSYSPMPMERVRRCKTLLCSAFAPVLGGQHSTMSRARNLNKVKRANFKSSRKFFAIC